MFRYLPNGSADPAFGSAGRVVTEVGTDSSYPTDVVVHPDGHLLVAGIALDDFGIPYCFVVRHLPGGALDPSFGSGGIARLTHQTVVDAKLRVHFQPDGRILVVNSGTLTRLNADGGPDASFAAGDVSLNGMGVDLELDEDGKILVQGTASPSFSGSFVLKRFLSDGALHPSFGDGGVVAAGTGERPKSAMVLAQGKIVVLGSPGVGIELTRYHAYSPPHAGGPYTTTESLPGLILDATGSSNRSVVLLSYSWDVNGDGLFGDASGINPTLSWDQLDALLPPVDGSARTFEVRVRIDDGQGYVAESPSTTLTVNPAIVFWTNPVGGNWSVGSNWSTGLTPRPFEDVVIDLGDNAFTVTISSGVTAVSSLTSWAAVHLARATLSIDGPSTYHNSLSISNGGTLAGSGSITLEGLFDWRDSQLLGSGTITANGPMMFGWANLYGPALVSHGTATWDGRVTDVEFGSRWINHGTLVLGDSHHGEALRSLRGIGGTFVNYGAVVKQGAGAGSFALPSDNYGTVEVRQGSLSWGTGSSPGDFTALPGTTLTLVAPSTSPPPRSSMPTAWCSTPVERASWWRALTGPAARKSAARRVRGVDTVTFAGPLAADALGS